MSYKNSFRKKNLEISILGKSNSAEKKLASYRTSNKLRISFKMGYDELKHFLNFFAFL